MTLPLPPDPARSEPGPTAPRRLAFGIGLVVVGLVASMVACLVMRRVEAARLQADFVRRAQRAAQTVTDGLQRHEDTLYALRAFLHYSPEVKRETFAGVARELRQRQTGVRALEWIERVAGPQREQFEARQRAEGVGDFEFRERISGSVLGRVGDRPEYFPVVYIEPLLGNEPALGFDLKSGLTWPALERIAGTGELAASGRLPLLSTGTLPDWGYIMQLPVYAQPELATTPEARRQQLRGYVLGIFHIAKTIESFFTNQAEDVLEILFLDRSAANPELEFLHYESRGRRVSSAADAPAVDTFASTLHLRVPVNHAGRNWELWFRPRAEWVAAQPNMRSWLVLALGIAVTGLGGTYVFGALRRERLVEQQVAERTAELRATQAELEQDNRHRREAERQLSTVLGQLPGAAFRCRFDAQLTVLFASDGMFQVSGYAADDFINGKVDAGELTVREDRRAARRAIARGVRRRTTFEFEARIRTRDGTVRWLLVRGRPVLADDGEIRFIEGLAIDVTALKAAEAEKLAIERKLLETQRLESLGVLAGGIAHDFNNLLTVMLGNATLARDDLPEGSPIAERLTQIENAAQRAADLCQQMLAYAGRRELCPRPLDLSELVRSTTTLLRVSIRPNTRLELKLAPDLPAVLADPAQLQQIVMNLVLNAAEAIGDQPGKIVVTSFVREVDAAHFCAALHQPELPSGLYVGLEVQDSGCGMSPDTLARIFDPFFTTKFSGRGLGLAAVLGIVQSHRGALFVETALGQGSTFRLLLQAQATKVALAPLRPTDLPRLSGTALVIDDEESVRDVLAAVLRRGGMTPFVAASGDEGLRILEAQGGAVDLVLLDLTMPGLSGEETLRAIRVRNPDQRVLVMSGYSEGDTMARCAELGVSGFLAKPFELQTLLKKLQAFGR